MEPTSGLLRFVLAQDFVGNVFNARKNALLALAGAAFVGF